MDPLSAWARYRAALAGEPLPAALVDLDALETNVDRLLAPVRARGKTLRLATKSVRCPALLMAIAARGGPAVRGFMTYTATETAFLAEQGLDDFVLAYPTLQGRDVDLLAGLCAKGASVAVMADAPEHLAALEAAAARAGTSVPVMIDVDIAYRPLGLSHIGVRRSSLREVADVVAFAQRIAAHPHLALHGVMAYEAHVAGVSDRSLALRWMKRFARPRLEKTRAALALALKPRVFNGGGTGSLLWCSAEDALTEVTAGSGFLDSHLFDGYRGLPLVPAAYFALQVTRRPAPGMVTCLGGGYIASGQAGSDRLPMPALPPGMKLLPLEGAGEVQTPLTVPVGTELALGDPVFFRHAKAGELAEHFDEYLLVRGDRIEARASTYRGLGRSFLG